MAVIDVARTERTQTTLPTLVTEVVRGLRERLMPGPVIVEDGALAGLLSLSDVVVLFSKTDRQASRTAIARQTPPPVRETERAKNNRPHRCS